MYYYAYTIATYLCDSEQRYASIPESGQESLDFWFSLRSQLPISVPSFQHSAYIFDKSVLEHLAGVSASLNNLLLCRTLSSSVKLSSKIEDDCLHALG